MAGLFDGKTLRVPPQMGARARGKLNKRGDYRMPPNLKGVTAAAAGGLGGAYTKGKKLRGYAEGGLIDISDQEPNEIRPVGADIQGSISQSGLMGGAEEDNLAQEVQQAAETGDNAPLTNFNEQFKKPSSQSPADNRSDIIKGADWLGQIRTAQAERQSLAEKYLADLKNPNEGGMNIPALQFAAGMLSPTRTGSFGESMGYGIGGGAQALANQRKQDMEYNTLKTKLGLDVSGQKVQDLIKLAEIDSNQGWKQLQYDLAKQKLENSKGKENKLTTTQEKALGSMQESAMSAPITIPKIDKAINLLDTVDTGSLIGSKPLTWLRKSTFGDEAGIEALEGAFADIQTDVALAKKTPGSISNFEVKLYNTASNVGMDKDTTTNRLGMKAYKLAKEGDVIKTQIWDEVKGDMDFNDFRSAWINDAFKDDPRVQAYKEKIAAFGKDSPVSKKAMPQSISKSQMNQAPTGGSGKVIKFDDLPD